MPLCHRTLGSAQVWDLHDFALIGPQMALDLSYRLQFPFYLGIKMILLRILTLTTLAGLR
jgi:hypothetical protein